MKIACIQLDISNEDQDKNFFKVSKLIREARSRGAELVCLPELFSTGVTLNTDKFAEEEKGRTFRFLSGEAKKNEIYLLGSLIEKSKKGLPKNTAVCMDPKGRMICRYHKNHVFTYGNENKAYSNGDGLGMFKIGKFNIAPFICYDLRFPEIFRISVEKGANMFIIIANWPNPRKEHWISLLKARAIENQSYVIGANRVGKFDNLTFFGNSMIISPKGEIVNQLQDKEAILEGELDMKEVTEWRKSFPCLRDRRIDYYEALKHGKNKSR